MHGPTIEIGGRTFRRFIPPPGPVTDGTLRCAHCGQIDDEPWHDAEICAERCARVEYYRAGEDRNEAAYGRKSTLHTYAQMTDGSLWPMCGYGWNRSNGERFSILRKSPGTEGDCKLCCKNVAAGRRPVFDGMPHKTKWL